MTLAISSWSGSPSQTTVKQRPAVVVSSATYNLARPDLVLMAVTSQLRAASVLGEVWIGSWQQAGLLKPSAVKPVFTTIEQRLVIRRLGALQPADQAKLRQAIAEVTG